MFFRNAALLLALPFALAGETTTVTATMMVTLPCTLCAGGAATEVPAVSSTCTDELLATSVAPVPVVSTTCTDETSATGAFTIMPVGTPSEVSTAPEVLPTSTVPSYGTAPVGTGSAPVATGTAPAGTGSGYPPVPVPTTSAVLPPYPIGNETVPVGTGTGTLPGTVSGTGSITKSTSKASSTGSSSSSSSVSSPTPSAPLTGSAAKVGVSALFGLVVMAGAAVAF